jgi:hypothetical protein
LFADELKRISNARGEFRRAFFLGQQPNIFNGHQSMVINQARLGGFT